MSQPAQLTLWEQDVPDYPHHHMEIVYLSGFRTIVCTASPERYKDRPGDWQWEAGYVGGALSAEECEICRRAKESRDAV